ncbi:MAG: exo-beta-N-acetylmuramidase NamZ domain-containing protein [Fimbriimonadaceae bacterium]
MLATTIACLALVKTFSGAEVMNRNHFQELEGLRVGLVTNHTAVVGNDHLIDVLFANKKIKLTALFGPEHGLRGLADAGAKVGDSVDEKTGVPVFSLYGSTRQPTKKMLANCDILVFDIQDVGARFYTYISTLGLCMQSAAESKIPFLILDRPNPLGGEQVSGFVLDPKNSSFVGQYPIPIQYGLTIGELATMIKGERWLPGLVNLELRVGKLDNWNRKELWPQTNNTWVNPSPNIPNFETALIYPGTCLFEAINASEGRGTTSPFLQVGAPYIDAEKTAADLNAKHLPGLSFEPFTIKPESIAGMSENPRFKNQILPAIQIKITDPAKVSPVEIGVHLLHSFYNQTTGIDRLRFFNSNWLSKLSGTTHLEAMLKIGKTPDEIIASWKSDVDEFKIRRKSYFLYD